MLAICWQYAHDYDVPFDPAISPRMSTSPDIHVHIPVLLNGEIVEAV